MLETSTCVADAATEFAALVPPEALTPQPALGNDAGETEDLTEDCAICLSPISDATTFPSECGHVYCATCIDDLRAHTPPTKAITCPKCRRQAPRPPRPFLLAPSERPPPRRISKKRRAVILVCMLIGVGSCFFAMAYDIGVLGTPFYASNPGFRSNPLDPIGHNNESLVQTQVG